MSKLILTLRLPVVATLNCTPRAVLLFTAGYCVVFQEKLVVPAAESEELLLEVAAFPKTNDPVGAFTKAAVPVPRCGVGALTPPGMVAADAPLKFHRARVSRTAAPLLMPTIW